MSNTEEQYREGHGKAMEKLTLELLEWPELCRELACYALSSRGSALCQGLLPLSSEEEAARERILTSEMVLFLERHNLLPISDTGDLELLLSRAQRGERLLGKELAFVAGFLRSVAGLRRALVEQQEQYPGLWGIAQALDEAAKLREAIEGALDRDGNVVDGASPRLGLLRKEARQSREAAVRRLEDFLRRQQAAGLLQDNYYTLRENRFVLPVRTEARSRLGGIVHDISSSGATCFLEPPWLVELNNSVKVAELEVEKEVERILGSLSSSVGEAAETLKVDQEVLARLDMVQARARLSAALGGCEPGLPRQGELILRGLCHPLLVLRGKHVVANDLVMKPGERVMVISGPNAGGKTVLLKALGLAGLMAKAGLHIAAEPGSCIPFFQKVFADIGDQQDINQDFSTFSAHMRNLREILLAASEGSLVLLDELAGSTDPQEGAALALATLERLMEKGALVVATTHYPQLKAWAQGRPGALNAAMEFDWERLTPTYRLRQGVPGQSSALEIARKMKLPEEVLEPALEKLQGDEIRLEALLRELQQERNGLEEERRKALAARARLEELAAQQEALVRSLKEEKEAFLREKRRRMSLEIQEAREKLRGILASLSGTPSRKKVQESRLELEELAAALRSEASLPAHKILPLGNAKPGDLVYVIPLGQEGILMDHPFSGKGRVKVLVGRMEVWVDTDSLGGVEPSRGQEQKTEQRASFAHRETLESEIPPQLDLRGKRAEEALEEMAQYLDKALLASRPQVRIIHGHGTGVLKRRVRQWLSECSWISGFRPGTRGEGGDGATVVFLTSEGLQQEAEMKEHLEQALGRIIRQEN